MMLCSKGKYSALRAEICKGKAQLIFDTVIQDNTIVASYCSAARRSALIFCCLSTQNCPPPWFLVFFFKSKLKPPRQQPIYFVKAQSKIPLPTYKVNGTWVGINSARQEHTGKMK